MPAGARPAPAYWPSVSFASIISVTHAVEASSSRGGNGLLISRRSWSVGTRATSMEGTTPFGGYEKPFEPIMPKLGHIAIHSFVSLVETYQAKS